MRLWFAICLGMMLVLGAVMAPRPAPAQTIPASDADALAKNAPPGPWIAVARGTVDASGGLMRLAAEREGLIAQVMAEEGDHVTKGQPLARLDDTAAHLQLQITEAEAAQAETQVELVRLRRDNAVAEAARLRPLGKADAMPRRQIDEANSAVRLAEIELTAAKQSAALAKSRIEMQQQEITARTVHAPVDGVIVRRTARPGDATSTSTVTEMFLLAPDGPRVLRAQLDEQFVGLVAPGQRAEIVRERDDGTTLTGTVQRVASVFSGAASPVGTKPTTDDARTIDITITLDGPSDAIARLVLGQRMIARILK